MYSDSFITLPPPPQRTCCFHSFHLRVESSQETTVSQLCLCLSTSISLSGIMSCYFDIHSPSAFTASILGVDSTWDVSRKKYLYCLCACMFIYIYVFVFVQGVLYISMTLLWCQTRTMLPPLPSLGLRHLGKRPVVNQRRGRQEVGAFFLSRPSDFLWHFQIWKHFELFYVIVLIWNVSFFPYWSKLFKIKTSFWNSPFVLFEDFRY